MLKVFQFFVRNGFVFYQVKFLFDILDFKRITHVVFMEALLLLPGPRFLLASTVDILLPMCRLLVWIVRHHLFRNRNVRFDDEPDSQLPGVNTFILHEALERLLLGAVDPGEDGLLVNLFNMSV